MTAQDMSKIMPLLPSTVNGSLLTQSKDLTMAFKTLHNLASGSLPDFFYHIPSHSILTSSLFFFLKDVYLFLCFGCAACGILVPQPEIEPVSPAAEVPSLHHWTTRGVPSLFFKCIRHAPNLRAFALTVSFSWDALPLDHKAGSFTYFRSLL